MLYLVSAFGIGFFGSFHCLGMCGPFALALPVHQLTSFLRVLSILAYNLGRLATYSLLGIVFAFLGMSFQLAGIQQVFSLILGVVLLFFILLSYTKLGSFPSLKLFYSVQNKLKSKFSEVLKHRSLSSFFILGMLNGLLPCGLVYLAIFGSIASETFFEGILFMVLFGMGTFPLMIILTFFGKLFTVDWRLRLTKLVPVVVSFTAVLLILRGLNLGIPYISPSLEKKNKAAIFCHDQVSSIKK